MPDNDRYAQGRVASFAFLADGYASAPGRYHGLKSLRGSQSSDHFHGVPDLIHSGPLLACAVHRQTQFLFFVS